MQVRGLGLQQVQVQVQVLPAPVPAVPLVNAGTTTITHTMEEGLNLKEDRQGCHSPGRHHHHHPMRLTEPWCQWGENASWASRCTV